MSDKRMNLERADSPSVGLSDLLAAVKELIIEGYCKMSKKRHYKILELLERAERFTQECTADEPKCDAMADHGKCSCGHLKHLETSSKPVDKYWLRNILNGRLEGI